MLVEPAGHDAQVLASFDDGAPALVLAHRGKGRVVLFTSSVAREWSDWPIRSSFVPVMQQLARELSRSGEGHVEPPSIVGRPHAIAAPEGLVPVSATLPSGKELPVVTLTGGGYEVSAPPELGLYRVRARADGKLVDAPSLDFSVAFDPRESDTSRLAPGELEARLGIAPSPHGPAESPGHRERPLWTGLLALALLAFLFEGLLLR
ncbi:MAG: hypothetical protein ACYCWW_03835 [Deltaproteobacteria bacterium]